VKGVRGGCEGVVRPGLRVCRVQKVAKEVSFESTIWTKARVRG
jgi:hypothetical protein